MLKIEFRKVVDDFVRKGDRKSYGKQLCTMYMGRGREKTLTTSVPVQGLGRRP